MAVVSTSKALNLEHHLSDEARHRLPNPMKSIFKLSLGIPDMINLANGDPHYSLYPFSEVSFNIPSLNEFEDPVQAWTSGSSHIRSLRAYRDEPCVVNLRSALQYGAGAGLFQVREAFRALNETLHSSKDHVVTLSLGNADSLSKCFRLLGDPGDSFLAEEFSFPGMTNAAVGQGITWVPVKLDKEGLIPEELEKILKRWDVQVQGKRPHVLYTIPCGQNPTGSTLTLLRRKQIYDIACRWDLIILEDDPYYFLQYDLGPVDLKSVHEDGFAKAFASTLMPSFLSLDVEGRVIRLDSLSKIMAPGMRLGWISSNSLFADKLEILIDSSTQHPHGFGQVLVSEMLLGQNGWGMDGLMKWVKSLCSDYQKHRDFFLDVFRREVGEFASTDVPEAGMFVWMKVHLDRHARFEVKDGGSPSSTSLNTNAFALMEELFQLFFNAGLTIMPASTFAILDSDSPYQDTHIYDRVGYFRATFAASYETIEQGMMIFGRVLKEFFKDDKTGSL